MLQLQMDDLYIQEWLEVVDNLAIDLLLATSSIDNYIGRRFSVERKIVPRHS